MIGFIFIGTLLGWIAAGVALASGAGLLAALGACSAVGAAAVLGAAGLSLLACPLRGPAPA